MSEQLRTGTFFGQCGHAFTCEHAVLTQVAHSCGRRLPEHGHERAYVSLLISGNYSERINGTEFHYRPMDAVFHPFGMVHSDRIGDGGATFLCAELLPFDPELHWEHARLMPHMLEADLAVLMIRLHQYARHETICPLVLESIVVELQGLLDDTNAGLERRSPHWMEDCIEYVRAEYRTSISVKGLARNLGLHPVYLAREFRKRVGEPLGEYVNKIRIKSACRQMLDETGRTLADVAAANGFYDQSHFVRIFAATIGCSPSVYRKSHRRHS